MSVPLMDMQVSWKPISLSDAPIPTGRKVNTALLHRPENVDIISFLETTAENAGRSLKCFTGIDKARTWLKSK